MMTLHIRSSSSSFWKVRHYYNSDNNFVKIARFLGPILIFGTAVCVIIIFTARPSNHNSVINKLDLISTNGGVKCKVTATLALILCRHDDPAGQKEERKSVANSFQRQINQTVVLFKSIIMQLSNINEEEEGRNCVNIYVVADSISYVDDVLNRVRLEGGGHFLGDRIKVKHIPVRYPKGRFYFKLVNAI